MKQLFLFIYCTKKKLNEIKDVININKEIKI